MAKMKKSHSAQKGFGILGLVIILVVAGIIGGVGYFVYHSHHKSKPSSTTTAKSIQPPAAPKLKLAAKPYDDPNTGLSLPYPDGWQIQKNPAQGVIVTFTPSPTLGDNAQIQVLIDNATGYTLDSYADSFRDGLAAKATNYKLISDARVTDKEGNPMRILTTSFDISGVNITTIDAIQISPDKTAAAVYDAKANTTSWDTYKDVYLQAAVD